MQSAERKKIHHWAHQSTQECDAWWEKETEWHRAWKNLFPSEWQEVIQEDDTTGEKHVADVQSFYRMTIEFQHSHIDTKERIAREQFYKNLVWVVDGTRLKKDYPRFCEGQDGYAALQRTGAQSDILFSPSPEKLFPRNWLECSVPVIFDFRGMILSNEPQDQWRNVLWCLLPRRAGGNAVVVAMMRKRFIDIILNCTQLFQPSPDEIVQRVAGWLCDRDHVKKEQARRQMDRLILAPPRYNGNRRWRRW